MATIAIGDLHGHRLALDGVLALVEAELGPGDTVVFLGDYIDRGADSRDCIERILRFRERSPAAVVGLLGNHEDWLLRMVADPTDHTWLLASEAVETIRSYSVEAADEIRRCARALGAALYTAKEPLPYSLFLDAMPRSHLRFLQSLRTSHLTADALCVHGGVDPDLGPLSNQTPRALIWGRGGFQQRYDGEPILVYGHWSNAGYAADGRAEPAVIGRTIGIDSIKYGTLTAVKLPDGLVLQSDGARSWVYSLRAARALANGGPGRRP